jgi:hypothetical protein
LSRLEVHINFVLKLVFGVEGRVARVAAKLKEQEAGTGNLVLDY